MLPVNLSVETSAVTSSPTPLAIGSSGHSVAPDSSSPAGPSSPWPDLSALQHFTRFETQAGQATAVSSLQVSGLVCAACAGLIEQAMAQVPGVLAVQVNGSTRRAVVRWDSRSNLGATLLQPLFAAVQAAGYQAQPDDAVSARQQRLQEQRLAVWRLFVAAFCAMQVMMLAWPSYVAEPGALAPDLRQLLNWASWLLSLPVLWFSAGPFFVGAWRSLRQRRISMDLPVVLGLSVAFLSSMVATFEPQGLLGDTVYFDSLTMFVAFLCLGRWLEMRLRHRAALALEESLGDLPQEALRIGPGDETTRVALAQLRVGDRVRVTLGGVIPADGRLLSATAGVSEALLTGEALAVMKRTGDKLLAGSHNLEAPLEMLLEQVGAQTRFESIQALVREAAALRPEAARQAERWAGPFLWAVLALAAAAFVYGWPTDPARALSVAVAVLIVTCPCALALAAPATLVAAAGGLAQRGILLRRLEALEAMNGIDKVFFDKTGTLTEDAVTLSRVDLSTGHGLPRGAWTLQAALQHAASLAQWSSHPRSRALVAAQQQQQQLQGQDLTAQSTGEAPAPLVPSASAQTWQHVEETPGAGLSAQDEAGRLWRLGSAAWALPGAATIAANGALAAQALRAHGSTPTAGLQLSAHQTLIAADAADAEEAAWTWLSCDFELRARFAFQELARADAALAVQALRSENIAVALLSGDAPGPSWALARALGIDQVVAQASPTRKLKTLRDEQARGRRVAMVGDGLNDAPVLAAAHVSLAMGHGAHAARSSADAIVVKGGALAVLDLLYTARRSARILRQNLAWSAAYNLACIPLALLGFLPPWAAGLGMAASSSLVLLNAQRAAQLRPIVSPTDKAP